jgi:hypothetical protein
MAKILVDGEDEERPKYLIFKQEEMTDWVESNLAIAQTIPAALDDAVVIRLKDPFAATALFTYCNTIMSFLELLESLEVISELEHQSLLDIADYFHSQALESEKIKGKRLPD